MARTELTPRARTLRLDQTNAEGRLYGWKWKRQVPRGPYIVDFLCADAHLVVELDGGQHADQVAYDERRTAWLKSQGLDVLRFWNSDVFENLEGVCETIINACGSVAPHPTSPRERGEED